MGAILQNGWSESSHVITADQVGAYAALTGDQNSIHFGDDAIVHGALLVGLVSATIWSRFGSGTVAHEITTQIRGAICPDEEFIIALSPAQHIDGESDLSSRSSVKFSIFRLQNDRRKKVLTGQATITPVKDQYFSEALPVAV